MPSFSFLSSIRVASPDHVLRLKITHNLVHGSPSDTVHSVKGRLPKELDILWLSDITISFSGSLDGQGIPTHDMTRSGLVRHLEMHLKANADRLSLNNVSRPFVDDADGLPRLSLTPSRPLPDAPRPHANLASLHLAYIWRSVAGRSAANSGHLVEEINPFAPTLFLPAETLLNRVTEQFFIYHLVSRYPLIFGSWCKRLDLEMQYVPSIARSIVEIMARSENHKFVSKCKRLIKVARRQHQFVLQRAIAALSTCTDDGTSETSEEEINEPTATSVLTDEQVLSASLEHLFREGVPLRRFKPVARDAPQIVPFPQDEEDSLLQYVPDARTNEDAWVELSETATSPLADCLETFLEEMDVFAEEDRSEGGMWRLHDDDVGWGERGFDDQSNGCLIGGSISSASINTRSAQASPVAIYHHQTIDDDELKPACNGSRRECSQSAHFENDETPAVFADEASHEPRDPYYPENYEQAMTCQVDLEGFEILESGSDRSEVTDSDSIWMSP